MSPVTLRPFAAALAALALAAPLAAQDAAEPPAAPRYEESGLRLVLNIPEQRLQVWDGDSLIERYVVSVGLVGHDTPDGEFTVQRAEWNPWWRPPAREWARDDKDTPPGPNNPMGRVKLFFAPYYYLHGTPHEAELGTPASHGCVRMRNRDVIELATLLHHRASPTVPPSAIRGILANSSATRWSTFRSPVPLRIEYEPVVVRDGALTIYKDIYNRRRIHTEAVYQALLAAGYPADTVDRATIRAVIQRARAARGTYTVSVQEAFGGELQAGVGETAAR
jgi:hypothetical protein